mmetsp:Transcript_32375/g.84927  ORF Transcript_32375/g.84927 Transcript_32375/m.84927 type:complete len:246 (+) Transcript_32375:582-1319(+)
MGSGKALASIGPRLGTKVRMYVAMERNRASGKWSADSTMKVNVARARQTSDFRIMYRDIESSMRLRSEERGAEGSRRRNTRKIRTRMKSLSNPSEEMRSGCRYVEMAFDGRKVSEMLRPRGCSWKTTIAHSSRARCWYASRRELSDAIEADMSTTTEANSTIASDIASNTPTQCGSASPNCCEASSMFRMVELVVSLGGGSLYSLPGRSRATSSRLIASRARRERRPRRQLHKFAAMNSARGRTR